MPNISRFVHNIKNIKLFMELHKYAIITRYNGNLYPLNQ